MTSPRASRKPDPGSAVVIRPWLSRAKLPVSGVLISRATGAGHTGSAVELVGPIGPTTTGAVVVAAAVVVVTAVASVAVASVVVVAVVAVGSVAAVVASVVVPSVVVPSVVVPSVEVVVLPSGAGAGSLTVVPPVDVLSVE